MTRPAFFKCWKFLLTLLTCTVLISACGGGGGGEVSNATTPPAPLVAPVITLTSSPTIYLNSVVTLAVNAIANTGTGITYTWDFGDGSAQATGTSVTHSYSKTGSFVVTVTASAAGYQSSNATKSITVNANLPPSAPVISVGGNGAVFSNNAQTFSAASTDPAGFTLAYSWNFGDGSAVVPGQNVTHTYTTAGSYTIKVTTSNTANLSTTNSLLVTVANATPAAPVIQANPVTVIVNQTANFTGSATDPMGLPLTYQWNFGDGTTGSGSSVGHYYSAAGSYTVTLTVTDSAGNTSNATVTETVVASSNSAIVADCSGTNCGASSATTYSGSGVGAWRYNNTGSTDVKVDITISGVTSGQTATLVFSNGTVNPANAPGLGVSASPLFVPPVQKKTLTFENLAYQKSDALHTQMLERNRQVALSLRAPAAKSASANPVVHAPLATPAVGAAKTWYDLYASTTSPTAYPTAAAAVCAINGGRNVVFWLDPNATSAGVVSAADITAMSTTVCGSAGFAQLKNLLGDVWGTAAAAYPTQLIQDGTGALQDINVVIVNAPADTGWAGYFYGYNNFLASSTYPNSNQALVFFINANQIQADRNYALSTLLHEATHMTNFYQRGVARNTHHETWLEESSAMMTEDIVVPALLGGYDTAVSDRLPSYLATGGAVSYINWPALSGANYALGGSFDAFLNRRYGLSIYKQLITNCSDGTVTNDSYTCLDTLIKNNGGVGFADEFTRFGASVFSQMTGTTSPSGYGFPFKSDSGYSLAAIDLSKMTAVAPTQLSAGFTATTHFIQVDAITKSSYNRIGVTVPAGTNLSLIIK